MGEGLRVGEGVAEESCRGDTGAIVREQPHTGLDHLAHDLTDLDRHLQERHHLDGPGSRRIGQTAAQWEGSNSTTPRTECAPPQQSYAITKKW